MCKPQIGINVSFPPHNRILQWSPPHVRHDTCMNVAGMWTERATIRQDYLVSILMKRPGSTPHRLFRRSEWCEWYELTPHREKDLPKPDQEMVASNPIKLDVPNCPGMIKLGQKYNPRQ